MPILALRFCSSTQHKPTRFYVYLLPLPLGTKPGAERTECSVSLTWVPLCRLHLKRQKEWFRPWASGCPPPQEQLSLSWGRVVGGQAGRSRQVEVEANSCEMTFCWNQLLSSEWVTASEWWLHISVQVWRRKWDGKELTVGMQFSGTSCLLCFPPHSPASWATPPTYLNFSLDGERISPSRRGVGTWPNHKNFLFPAPLTQSQTPPGS